MVESTGLENRRCESIRGFESHSLRQKTSYLRKYPSGRRGSPAKGVGRQKRREGSNPSFRAKSRNRGTTTVPRFFLYSCGFAGFVLSAHHADFKPVVCTFGERITHKLQMISGSRAQVGHGFLCCSVLRKITGSRWMSSSAASWRPWAH